VCQTAIIVNKGLSHPAQEVQFQKVVRQTAITIFKGLSHSTGWAALSSENISRRFFKFGETEKFVKARQNRKEEEQ
jgi:hypothetical protein